MLFTRYQTPQNDISFGGGQGFIKCFLHDSESNSSMQVKSAKCRLSRPKKRRRFSPGRHVPAACLPLRWAGIADRLFLRSPAVQRMQSHFLSIPTAWRKVSEASRARRSRISRADFFPLHELVQRICYTYRGSHAA